MTLCISDRGSSSDSASIVGGALQRIFQPLRDEIDHHIPSCTAVVLVEAHAPNHKAAKALIHRDQVWHLVLKPGRMLAPSRLRAHRRKGADGRKFAEPSDDLHHIACLSSVRACCSLRRRPRLRATLIIVLRQPRQPVSCLLSFKNIPSLTKAVKQPNGHPNSPTATLLEHTLLTQGFMEVQKAASPCCLQPQNRDSTWTNLAEALK